MLRAHACFVRSEATIELPNHEPLAYFCLIVNFFNIASILIVFFKNILIVNVRVHVNMQSCIKQFLKNMQACIVKNLESKYTRTVKS